jgi:hypothetical protein
LAFLNFRRLSMNRKQLRIDNLDNEPTPSSQPEWLGVVITIFVILR